MTSPVRWLGALLCAGAFVSAAQAQYHPPQPHWPYPPGYVPYPPQPIPWAPDACGSGFYTWCPDGSYLGPNYCLYPPFPPFNGMLPAMKQQGPPPGNRFGQAGQPGQAGQAGQSPQQPAMMPNPGAFAYAYATAPAAARPPLQRALVPVAPMLQPYRPTAPQGQPPQVAFPSHPYARSPRDFFMWGEAQEDLHTREARPRFVP